MNDFSKLDAQDEMSRLAQVTPEENKPIDFSSLSEDDIDNLSPQEQEAYWDWFEADIRATIEECKAPTEDEKRGVLSFLEATNILIQIHSELRQKATVLLAGERGEVNKFLTQN